MAGMVSGQFDYSDAVLCGELDKSEFKAALDNACAAPDADPTMCSLKDVIVGLLACKNKGGAEMCSLVVEMEGVEVASLEDL